jgi:hypothetical protein
MDSICYCVLGEAIVQMKAEMHIGAVSVQSLDQSLTCDAGK